MRFSIATIVLVAALFVEAAPVRRQGAGVGAACDSIFTDGDTMIGESVRGTGKTLAGAIAGKRGIYARQGAGVGQGCDAAVSDADTMGGESSRGVGKTIAQDIPHRRQLNGISDGVTAPLEDFSATSSEGSAADTYGNDVDGDLTNDAAQNGEEIGNIELATGSFVGGENGESGGSTGGNGGGNPPPPPPGGPGHKRRQLNGIADGVTAPLEDFSATSATGSSLDSSLNQVDGEGTDGSAQLGEEVGAAELEVGQTVGGQNGQNGGSAPPPGPKRR